MANAITKTGDLDPKRKDEDVSPEGAHPDRKGPVDVDSPAPQNEQNGNMPTLATAGVDHKADTRPSDTEGDPDGLPEPGYEDEVQRHITESRKARQNQAKKK
jgi:hypothetical protein